MWNVEHNLWDDLILHKYKNYQIMNTLEAVEQIEPKTIFDRSKGGKRGWNRVASTNYSSRDNPPPPIQAQKSMHQWICSRGKI